jgi:hypothetical protein
MKSKKGNGNLIGRGERVIVEFTERQVNEG